jgi:hypothetical protein
MPSFLFSPHVETVGTVDAVYSIAELDEETSMYAASPAFVREHGGPIANSILANVDVLWFDRCADLGMLPNVDVRVHRLNIGEFPAVPGWHCDGVMRETYHAQPDLERIRVRDTVIAHVSSDASGVSCTEFLVDPFELQFPDFTDESGSGAEGYALWRDAHLQIEAAVPRPRSATLESGRIVCMSATTLHRPRPAVVRGWRLFFRMSMWHRDYLGEQGKVARQQQVYLLSESNGW